MTLKFLKKGIRAEGQYIPVHYSQGEYTKESKIPKGSITIYAKSYSKHLPSSLNVKNESDGMTDYFETDRATIFPTNPHFKNLLKVMGKR